MDPVVLALAVAAIAVVGAALGRSARHRPGRGRPKGRPSTGSAGRYPGDFTGRPTVSYSPRLDGAADPGEIVWTWVPFEEDHTRGKDRPVLLIGRDGRWLLGLMLSSKGHDAAQPARGGRRWVDIGAGAWDRQRRPSEVRLDRIVRVDPASVRREGAILDKRRFDDVIREAKIRQGW